MKHKTAFNSKKFSGALSMFTEGVALRTLAKNIGVSASTLSRVQRGERPDIETFGRICRWIGVSEKVFFYHVREA